MAQLPNHLRSYRVRTTLSQNDVAFLTGTVAGDLVCRFERFNRVPDVRAVLAFETIFGKSVGELFPGLHKQIREDVGRRAKVLLYKIERGRQDRTTPRKRQVLTEIINAVSNNNTQ